MRLTLVASAVAAVMALTGCAGIGNVGPDNLTAFHPNCEQQADWARNGRTDGREIIITCPQPGPSGIGK